MEKGSQTVTIEKLVEGGQGLARLGSHVMFVRGSIPAETVSVTGGKQHKGFQDATVTGVLVASPDRVVPPCPVYGVCGGCQLQHLRYDAQLVQKREILIETLARVGKVNVVDVPSVLGSPNPYGYRSTVRFVIFHKGDGFTLGFHEHGTHEPVAGAACLLVPEALRPTILEVNRRLGSQRRMPLRLEGVEVRHSIAFGSILLIWRTGPATAEQADAVFTLCENLPVLAGQVVISQNAGRWVQRQDWIADRLDDLLFRISDRSFMQANWTLTGALARTVAEWIDPVPGLRVLELYAGIGTLGLPLARRGALVTEVEANQHALADARHAAKTNHIGRCRFRPARAEAILESVQPGEYDVVLLDPPRTGVSPEGLQGLVRLNIPRLFYLSCDAPTLARDLSRLSAAGYRIHRIQPFDMFPQTAHLESLVELRR